MSLNSSLLIKCVPLGCVICFSSNMLCNINLWRYFSYSVGVSVGMLLACDIHCVSNGIYRGEGEVFEYALKVGCTCCFE